MTASVRARIVSVRPARPSLTFTGCWPETTAAVPPTEPDPELDRAPRRPARYLANRPGTGLIQCLLAHRALAYGPDLWSHRRADIP
jgi:hypothetical protein